MTTLTEKFTALEEQLTSDHNEEQTALDNIYALLGSMSDTLTTIQDNNATNTRLLYDAIVSSNACNTCPSVPISGTPPITDAQGETGNFCKRVQALLHVVSLFCTYADDVGTLSSAFSTGFITSIIDQVRLDTDDSGIPYPAWLDTLAIAADGVNFVINRTLLGGGAHATFDPIQSTLQADMFAAGSASAAQSAYNDDVDGTSGLAASKPLLKAFLYGDLVNYFLDPSSTPNLTGYSATACGEVEDTCIDLPRVVAHSSAFGTDFGCIQWPTGWPTRTLYARNSDTLSLPVVLVADLTGYTFTPHGGNASIQDQSGATTAMSGGAYAFTGAETELLITILSGVTGTFCGPDLPPPAR
jgi:hypothetical protein